MSVSENLLTTSSKIKYDILKKYVGNDDINDDILKKVKTAFVKEIIIESYKSCDIIQSRKSFVSWNKELNGKSVFEQDIELLDRCLEVILKINDFNVTMNILYNNNDANYVSVIIHATNTFFHIFNPKTNNLKLSICLNDHERSILKCSVPKEMCIHKMQNESLAMTVSGTTNRMYNTVYVTRKEEIIKLLFHELIHYVGLDHDLLGIDYKSTWDIHDNLNLSEAYTEFLSIQLNSAYLACQLNGKNNSSDKIFQTIINSEIFYSVYLCVVILKFYGYSRDNYRDFFNKKQHYHEQPICLWEYIFIRAILMLQTNKVMNKMSKTDYHADNFIIFMKNDKILIDKMDDSILWDNDNDSGSYLMLDINWNI